MKQRPRVDGADGEDEAQHHRRRLVVPIERCGAGTSTSTAALSFEAAAQPRLRVDGGGDEDEAQHHRRRLVVPVQSCGTGTSTSTAAVASAPRAPAASTFTGTNSLAP